MRGTKNELKAKVALMVSLAAATRKMYDDIIDSFDEELDDNIFDVLGLAQTYEITDADEIMAEFEDYTADMEEGEPVNTPYVHVDHIGSIETGVTYPDGSKLAGYLTESDFGTWAVGGIRYSKECSPVDLCMAEIKKGELAEVKHLKPDNNNVDIYVWADVFREDYTHHYQIEHKDILEALEESEEGGEDNE